MTQHLQAEAAAGPARWRSHGSDPCHPCPQLLAPQGQPTRTPSPGQPHHGRDQFGAVSKENQASEVAQCATDEATPPGLSRPRSREVQDRIEAKQLCFRPEDAGRQHRSDRVNNSSRRTPRPEPATMGWPWPVAASPRGGIPLGLDPNELNPPKPPQVFSAGEARRPGHQGPERATAQMVAGAGRPEAVLKPSPGARWAGLRAGWPQTHRRRRRSSRAGVGCPRAAWAGCRVRRTRSRGRWRPGH